MDQSLKRADEMIEEYRKERRQAKRLSWVETIVKECLGASHGLLALRFAGTELASPYIRQQKKFGAQRRRRW